MTSKLPTAMVLGNCTAASIAAALRKSGYFAKVNYEVLFSMPRYQFDQQAQALDFYDFILTIEHGEAFGSLSTNALKNRYTDKIITLPTPFFSGLMPDMVYLKKDNQVARAEGVMGDYHSALILRECKDGLSCDEVVRRYESGEAFDRLDIRGVFYSSLNELKHREAQTDIKLSNYIEDRIASGMIVNDFLSMNHPTEGLINHIAQNFTSIVIDAAANIIPLEPIEHQLNASTRWPLHPEVAHRMGLLASPYETYRAKTETGYIEFSQAEFAARSFEYFCVTNNKDTFEILSPRYFQDHFC